MQCARCALSSLGGGPGCAPGVEGGRVQRPRRARPPLRVGRRPPAWPPRRAWPIFRVGLGVKVRRPHKTRRKTGDRQTRPDQTGRSRGRPRPKAGQPSDMRARGSKVRRPSRAINAHNPAGGPGSGRGKEGSRVQSAAQQATAEGAPARRGEGGGVPRKQRGRRTGRPRGAVRGAARGASGWIGKGRAPPLAARRPRRGAAPRTQGGKE
ncbi:MAG: hypothetical protein J3K34DRAFT_428907 [Monoraphidium minutum]|nr:MAG: hypothetical protein J3K34DRAFT_428907 [Monoraphidium minutum]